MRGIRFLSVLMCALLAFSAGALAQERIAGASTGNAVVYASIGDWTVRNDFVDGLPVIVAEKGGEQRMLASDALWGFIPAWDAVVFYAPDANGKLKWQIRNPDLKVAVTLPLKLGEEPIYADAEHIWCYAMGEGSGRSIFLLDHDGKNGKRLGTLDGTVVGMLEDGSVLCPFYARNYVRAWKNGKYEMLYESQTNLTNAFLVGGELWVEEAEGHGYGPVRDGVQLCNFEGNTLAASGSGAQTALVVRAENGAARYGVYLLDGETHAIAKLGDMPACNQLEIAMTGNAVVVWGDETPYTFDIPEESGFYMYWDADQNYGC